MNNFNFYNPTKIIFGQNTIPTVGKEIARFGIKKLLILTGGGSVHKSGVFDEAAKSLAEAGIAYIEKSGVQANPALVHALEAVDLARKESVDGILAIGGGSVIDESKAVAVGYYLDNLWGAYSGKVVPEKALPLFTILTLSGTGTEMNMNSVLTNTEEHKKWALYTPHVFPKFSIIDPSVQMSLPWHQTVNGAIDAMAHTMEFYSTGRGQETSLGICEALFKSVIKSLDILMIDPRNYQARADIAWASTVALNGIAGAGYGGGDWASHRIEHGISALHPEVAHGAGLAVIIPAWIRYINLTNFDLFSRWAKNVWDAESVEGGIERMKDKQKSWGAPTTLTELGIRDKEITGIAANAMMIGPIGNMQRLDREDIESILRLAL